MSKVEIELNFEGIGALLKSTEMQSLLEKKAATIANRAGGEHEVYVAPTRAVAEVRCNKMDNSLLRGLR